MPNDNPLDNFEEELRKIRQSYAERDRQSIYRGNAGQWGGNERPNDLISTSEPNIIKTLLDWGIKLVLLFLGYLLLAPFIGSLLTVFITALNNYAWILVILMSILLFAAVKAFLGGGDVGSYRLPISYEYSRKKRRY